MKARGAASTSHALIRLFYVAGTMLVFREGEPDVQPGCTPRPARRFIFS
jgi:hypothetical protein